jgi:cobalamin biosynthesis protein CobC
VASPLGWTLVGGTPLFRLYETGDAHRAQETLARAKIWSRVFPYQKGWLRLGLPGSETEWARLSEALANSTRQRE